MKANRRGSSAGSIAVTFIVIAIVVLVVSAVSAGADTIVIVNCSSTNTTTGGEGGTTTENCATETVTCPTTTLVTTSTATSTVTTTEKVGPSLIVHVTNEYGVWENGALVEIYRIPTPVSTSTSTSSSSVSSSNTSSSTTTSTSSNSSTISSSTSISSTSSSTNSSSSSSTFVTPSCTPATTTSTVTASTTTTTTAASTIPSTELDSTLLVANGTTVAGVFYSGPLYANSTYTVYAYTSVGLSANQTVKVGMSDVSINLEIPVPQPPNVAITNVVMSPSVVNPGTTFGALVTVQNEGNSTAYGVLLSLSVASPFTLQNAGSSEDLGNLAAGASKSFTLPVDVSYTAKAGSYTIGYTLNYSDAASNAYVSTGNIGVQVSGNPLTPNLIVSTVSFAPSALNPGSSFQATVDVSNIGYSASYNGLLSLTIPSPISLVGSSSSIALGTIAANGSRSYTFSAYVPTTAKAGSYSVSYTFTYNDKLGTSYTGTGSLSIVVVSPATVLLQDVAFLSPTLTPGTDTQLQMLVVNGGGDDALNVKVSWAGDASFLSNSTNFLGAIAPGAGTNSSFGLIIPSSTQPGSFNSTLAVSYTDSAGVFHESVIPFPIRVQPLEAPVLTITNTLLDPPVLSPGTQGTFTIYTSNIGTSTVYNVVVSITNGSKIFSSTTFGLGAVGAGAQVTTVVGVDVSPNIKPGSYVLGIETTYTDQAGVTHTSSVPLEITVYHSTSIFTATNLAIIVAVVIVAVAAGIVTNFTLKRRAQTQT